MWYETFLREGAPPVLKTWRDKAQIHGRPVKVTSFREVLSGTAIDVDSDGALILETKDGERKRVLAGDIQYGKMSNVKVQSSKSLS
jgi:BirA family biotin operon repressor/biotin-[acetyl-CoA-carboxylase] ligase